MSRSPNPQPGRRRWRDLTEGQQQARIIGLGFLVLVLVVATVVMLSAWGLRGTLWRVGGAAAVTGLAWLAWKKRRQLSAAAKAYAERAAAQRAKSRSDAAAEAAAERSRQSAFAASATATGQRQTAPTVRFGRAAPPPVEVAHSIEWLGVDKVVKLPGFEITRPMTYIVRGRQADMDEPSLLNAALPVSKNASQFVNPLPYWPSFAQMDPDQRWVYLAWMTLGRRQIPPEIGYAFVFLYGLERRALVDQADHAAIFDEVLRLRQLHAAAGGGRFSWSFENYTSSFLWFLAVCFPANIGADRVAALAETVREWTEEKLSGLLACFMLRGQPLPAWAGYIVASQQPGAQRSVVIDRVNEQFRELFAKRYEQRWGGGIDLKSSKREFCYSYKPASSALPGWQMTGANPLGIKSQFKGLDEVWNSCIDDLRKLSGKLRDGSSETTPAMWEAMPPEIRPTVEHPLTEGLCKLVGECTDEENRILLPVARLVEAFKLGPAAAARKKLTPTESQMICRHVAFVGYRLEPDAYFTGNAYRIDEKVAAFLKTSDEATDHTRYNAAACMLQLGLVIASADGQAHADELKHIAEEIERTFQLNAQEQRRLAARRGLLLAEGADTKGLSQMIESLTPPIRQGIARLLLAVVAADGIVTKEEIRATRKCYSTLGFSKAEVDQAIDALRVGSGDEPVTVQAGAARASGEAIPPPAEAGFTLNKDTIAAIMKDTEEVARILAAAMSADQRPVPANAAAVPPDAAPRSGTPAAPAEASSIAMPQTTAGVPSAVVPANVLIPTEALSKALAQTPVVATSDSTLPVRYAAFYQVLITQPEWSVADVEALARQHGLMRSGAIDELNEWAAEKFGGQLFIEDGPKLIVEQSYLN